MGTAHRLAWTASSAMAHRLAGLRTARASPDVLVMDMHVPGVFGAEATPLVFEAAPRASMVMLIGVMLTQTTAALSCSRRWHRVELFLMLASGVRRRRQGHS